ncbi:MAG TPA: tetratricopeptide repeat protein [Roseiflexaceae bacterium]|nr:tetratricopeptide repeat protein [Roseiflexaceae bacterium]
MDERSTFGRWVKWRRNTLGLTQASLAQQVACSKDLIKKIESDTRRPSVQIVRRLADALEIGADDYTSFFGLARPDLSAQPHHALGAQPAPPERAPAQRLVRLPAPSTRLVNRAGELGAICALLRLPEHRLVTLTGSGGIGKTRLAIELAAELQGDFADGVVFVPLAPISDPALVLPTVAQGLGVPEPPDQPMLAFLGDYLRTRALLLVLDNFEQVAAAAPEVAALLAAAPHLKIIITSRAVLHMAGEREFVVPPLELPEKARATPPGELGRYPAVALFVERAQAAKPDFELTADNAPAVVEICARLDGLPLAIELAAARARLLPPQALLARLSGGTHISPLDLLARSTEDVPARQQTLRNTIGWSYELLSPAEQQVFRWLGVFVGGCSLDAAEQVCGGFGAATQPPKAPKIYDLLASLIDQSLVAQGLDAGGEPRFTMLTTLREYALERLADCGELQAARRAHAAYFLSLTEQAEPTFQGAAQQTWLARLEADHDNMRAALSWMCGTGAGEDALRCAAAFWQFWLVRGYLSEGQSWIANILALPAAAAPTLNRARVLNGGGLIAWIRSMPRAAIALLGESLGLFRQLGNKHGCAWALNHLAQVAFAEARFDDVIALGEESLALFQEIGAVWNSAWVLLNLGDALWAQGHGERASALFAESLSLFHDSGDKRGTAWAIDHLARVAQAQGDYQRAAAFLGESLSLFRELGDRSGCAWALGRMAQLAEATGERQRARALYAESLGISQALGDKSAIAACLISLANLTFLEGRAEHAVSMLGAADLILASLAPRLNGPVRTTLERFTADGRALLDPVVFSAAWAAGQANPADQVIARVLAES